MFTGADVDDLDQAALAFRRSVERTESATLRMRRVVRDLTADRVVFGPFAETYASELVRDVLGPLSASGVRLLSFAEELDAHAEEQRKASAAKAGGGPEPLMVASVAGQLGQALSGLEQPPDVIPVGWGKILRKIAKKRAMIRAEQERLRREGLPDGNQDDPDLGPSTVRPNTPQNDPSWRKSVPEDRVAIRKQVDEIREHANVLLNELAKEAWDWTERNWDTIKQSDEFKERIKSKPEDMLKGNAADRKFEELVNANLDLLVDEDKGYLLKTQLTITEHGPDPGALTKSGKGKRQLDLFLPELDESAKTPRIRPDLVLARRISSNRPGGVDFEVVHVWDLKTGPNQLIDPAWARKANSWLDLVLTPETLNPRRASIPPPVPR